MAAILLFSLLGIVVLALLLARYAKAPAALRSEVEGSAASGTNKPRISAAEFRVLAAELLAAMGMRIQEGSREDARMRLVATKEEPLAEVRYVVFLEAAPAGDVVDQATIVELLGS